MRIILCYDSGLSFRAFSSVVPEDFIKHYSFLYSGCSLNEVNFSDKLSRNRKSKIFLIKIFLCYCLCNCLGSDPSRWPSKCRSISFRWKQWWQAGCAGRCLPPAASSCWPLRCTASSPRHLCTTSQPKIKQNHKWIRSRVYLL